MNAIAPVQRSRFRFEAADERDDAELRSLLRRTPVEGGISVTFEREPSFFEAAAIQGEFHQVGVARDLITRKIVGMGTRSVTAAFLNGQSGPLGYLSDLRLEPKYRNGTLVARGYRLLREFHQDNRTELYYTVIFSENERALKTVAQGRVGLPKYHDCGRLLCPGINIFRRKPSIPFDGEIVQGDVGSLPEIVECLNRNNQRRQFAPVHRVEDFLSGGRWLGFEATDFYVARRNGKIVGVLGRWDQREFKQTRVVGYAKAMDWIKPLANALHPLVGTPRVPEKGEILPYFYASFVAVDDDDLHVFRALLRQMYNDATGSEFRYFLIGLHEGDPLVAALEDYSLTPFSGHLFCVCYEAEERAWRELDQRCPYIEVATL